MKKFSELGIKNESQNYQGDKIKTSRLLNTEITIHDYKIVDSKFGNGNEKCLHMQISLKGVKHVVFNGSIALAETLNKIPKSEFPFETTIVKENERYEFT